jgi:hypothetical protein
LTETDDAAAGDIIADIAALARKLAETEPCQSASGPDALRALAARLDAMVAPPRRSQPAVIQVAMRSSRKKPAR